MRLGFAFIVLVGLAAAVLLFDLEGGKGMSMLSSGTEVRASVPLTDMHFSGTFETATFALG